MSNVVAKLSSAVWVKYIHRKLRVAFSSKYLLLTNTAITVSLSGTGDILQQNYEMFRKRQQAWSGNRTRQICTTGLIIGPCCHYWYKYLDRILPGTAWRTVLRKILLDQVIFSPINIGLFLIVLGYLEGSQVTTVLKELREKGADLLKAEWVIWPPAQLVNFCFVNPKYRVLYDNTVSLGFDYYYSYVKFRKDYSQSDIKSGEETNKVIPFGHTFVGVSMQQGLIKKHLKDVRKSMFDL